MVEAERLALARAVREAYMEIFPTPTIEERLAVLEPGSWVAVTCSPSKGIGETLELTTRLAGQGFRVVPHIAAKMVRDRAHLAEIMACLNDLPVDSMFIPGGDAPTPAGRYHTAFDLLRDLADCDHRLREIGIAAHPEGHPDVADSVLMEELGKKQPLATYLVTQMCFDAAAIADWLKNIRDRGIMLPAWLGIPGVADRGSLLKTSLRIGVGDSLRFLRKQSSVAMHLLRSGKYAPDRLLADIAPLLADPKLDIAGFHVYCFNQVAATEDWRQETLRRLAGVAS